MEGMVGNGKCGRKQEEPLVDLEAHQDGLRHRLVQVCVWVSSAKSLSG